VKFLADEVFCEVGEALQAHLGGRISKSVLHETYSGEEMASTIFTQKFGDFLNHRILSDTQGFPVLN
jgi:hypothetical protein